MSTLKKYLRGITIPVFFKNKDCCSTFRSWIKQDILLLKIHQPYVGHQVPGDNICRTLGCQTSIQDLLQGQKNADRPLSTHNNDDYANSMIKVGSEIPGRNIITRVKIVNSYKQTAQKAQIPLFNCRKKSLKERKSFKFGTYLYFCSD